jgi:HAD superfamily hydrolase (TIGR01549 family)
MLKGFLFDLDGTIWDSEKVIVKTIFQAASEIDLDVSDNQIVKQFKNSTSPIAVLKHYCIPADLFWKFYRKNYLGIELFFGNTVDIFGTLLERKRSIGFITSLKKEFALVLLQKFNLSEFPKIIITPSECRTTKPSPAPINMALNHLCVENVQAMYIGDQNSDIVAAKRTGCKSGLAKWGMRKCVEQHPDYVFEKLSDVLPLSEEDE